jgi:hypothetical protein
MSKQADKKIVVDYDNGRMTVSEVWDGTISLPSPCDCCHESESPVTCTVEFVTYDGPIPSDPIRRG